MRFRSAAGIALGMLLAARAFSAEGDGPRPFHFVDVGGEAGLDRITWCGRPSKDHLLDSAGTGAAFLDYDRDGHLDVYVVNGWRLDGAKVVERARNALYRGTGAGRFRDVTDECRVAGEGSWGCGVNAVDYDRDGWTDLFLTNFGSNVLYRNRGDGTFENVAPRLGVESPGWNTGAAFFDADEDGDLDLYVARYIDCSLDDVLQARRTLQWKERDVVAVGPFGLKGAPDRFFRAEGGKFVDQTALAGFEDRALGFGFGVLALDYDDDGDKDVFVANDSDANYYFRGEGEGRFREMGIWSGCALNKDGSAQASMGVASGDVDGDSVLDLFVTAFAEDSSTLYRGLGGGLFEDVTIRWSLQTSTYLPLSWGAALADLDNDGDLDLVEVNGHIYPQVDRHPEVGQSYAQRNEIFENRGGKFIDASAGAGPGFQLRQSSRGLAFGDHDNDGDLDLLVTRLDQPPLLLRNDSPGGSWLTVVSEDEKGPISAVGLKVTVTAGGRKLTRHVTSGDSYLSAHDPRLHFGLGMATVVERVEVEWPGGKREVRENVPVRQFLCVRRPR